MCNPALLLVVLIATLSLSLADKINNANIDGTCAEKAQARNKQGKPTLNNIGYLGSGYDVIFANPRPTETKAGIDPGYRRHIFDLTNYCGDVTADQRYQIPENVTVYKQVSGKLHFHVQVINSTRSFTKTLGTSYQIAFGLSSNFNQTSTGNSGWIGKIISEGVVSVIGTVATSLNPAIAAVASGIGKLLGNFGTISSETDTGNSGLAFSASRDFKHVTEEITKRHSRFIETLATSTVYKASINTYAAPSLSRNFRQAVETLPALDYDEIDVRDERFVNFFNEYGTHVVMSVLMGASYGERYSIDENSWSKLESRNINWKLGASLTTRANICRSQGKNTDASSLSNCIGMGGEQTPGFSKNDTDRDSTTFSQMLSDRSVFAVGSLPPANLEVESWVRQSFDNPVPVHLTLDLIVNLITKRNFPHDPLIAKKRAGLLKALANYCEAILKPAGHVSSCDPIEDVSVPVDDFKCKKLGKISVDQIVEAVRRRTHLPQSEFTILPASFNNKFYLIVKEQVSRIRGNEPCKRSTKGSAKLVTMERESEFNCVTSALSVLNGQQLGNHQRHFWIGMTREVGNTFFWENGAPFTYSLRWASKEPNNATKWSRYRGQLVPSEDHVILQADDRLLGTADGFRFNDVSEIADWPSPLCEGQLQSFEILPFSTDFYQPVRFRDAINIRNQRYLMPLKGPLFGLAHYASLETGENGDDERRHCHLQGRWVLEEKGWFYEKWKKITPVVGATEVHFGDIIQISNIHGNPVLDGSGTYNFGDVDNGWRSSTYDLWRIHPCYPAFSIMVSAPVVNYGDCVLFENIYYNGCYLYAYQQIITSTHYLSCSKNPSKKQLWVIEI